MRQEGRPNGVESVVARHQHGKDHQKSLMLVKVCLI
jgi:hypothetical protein